MDRYLIFLDIDGTLLTSKGISERNKEAIRRARAAGHLVFINTGRSYGNVPEAVLSLETDGFVCGLGTYINYGGKVIKSVTIDKPIALKTAEHILEKGLKACFECEDGSLFMNMGTERRILKPEDLEEKFSKLRLSKLTLFEVIDDAEANYLSQFYTVYRYETYSEAVKIGYSKVNGMKTLGAFFGINREHMMAIGDSANDFDMVSYAGIGIAMGNAEIVLKKNADYITSSVYEDGVAEAIEEHILGVGKNESGV